MMLLFGSSASADTLAGRASVIDGDTIEIHDERIRILDIDAPESRQTCTKGYFEPESWPCGQKAALALSDWIGEKPVTCDTEKRDRYGRHLARCTVGGEDIALWLTRRGWAVPYRDCKCEAVRGAAMVAEQAKRGIWAGKFEMPWDWRKKN